MSDNNKQTISQSSAQHAAHAPMKQDTAYVVRKKKKKKHRMSKGKRVLIIILVVILAIIIGSAAALAYVNFSMSNQVKETNQKANVTVSDTSDNGQTISYKGHTYKLNEDIISILILGHDNESEDNPTHTTQADLISVAAIDTKTGSINIIGIPRDSYVDVDQYGIEDGVQKDFIGQEKMQLCLAYSYGVTQSQSVTNVDAAVERVLYNIPIQYYLDLYEDGINDINDSIGGVTVVALDDIPNTEITEGDTVTLLGTNARKYVQYRDVNVPGSSLQRHERQMQYIKSFISQLFSNASGNVGTFVDVYNTASQYIGTNLDVNAVIYLAQCCISNGVDFSNTTTLQGTMDTTSSSYNRYILNEDNVKQTVIDVYYKQVD